MDEVVLFINESSLANSPQADVQVLDKFKFTAILDSGSDVNLLSERIYEERTEAGAEIPILPVEGVALVTAFGRRSKRIRRQALLEFEIGQDVFETILLVSPQLNNDAIFGCHFLRENGVTIGFNSGKFSYVRGGVTREWIFAPRAALQGACSNDSGEIREPYNIQSTLAGQRLYSLSADCANPLPHPPEQLTTAMDPYHPPPNVAAGQLKALAPIFGSTMDHLT
jgi:hypothetical protein